MVNEIIKIANFMGEAFLHIWPYLLVTIPLAVAVNMSGASKYIKRAFDARPITAIFLATIVGAFSPFCSCGVIPVIAALLISAFGTGHVLLDRITLHGPGNLFLKCRNHRVELGGMALDRNASLKPECRVHHPCRYATEMDRHQCPSQPQRFRHPKYLFTNSKRLAGAQRENKAFFLSSR